MRLDARLAMLAKMAEGGAFLADIGCDHGRLAAHMLLNEKAAHAQLCDISAPSLEKARALLALLPIDKARYLFSVGDGLCALVRPADRIVIAGMGGQTICDILRAGQSMLSGAALVLLPNVKHHLVRQCLLEIGYRITDEQIAFAGRRGYAAMRAQPGAAAYTPRELEVGPVLLDRGHPLLPAYAQVQIRALEKAVSGAQGKDEGQVHALSQRLSHWRKVQA